MSASKIEPRLVAFTDTARFPEFASLVRLCRASRPGSVAVVLRDRQRSLAERLETGRLLAPRVRDAGQLFIVAGRWDLGLELGADGLHLGAADVTPTDARRHWAPDGWLSRAAHGIDALDDEAVGALDAVVVSPVLAPRKGREALGLEGFAREAARLRARRAGLRVFALGGIDAGSAGQVLAAGADGVALLGAAYTDSAEALACAMGIAKG